MNKPVSGVAFALGAALMLASMNMIAKLLSAWFTPVEITFYRNLIAFVILVAILWAGRHMALMKTKRPGAQFIRALVGTIGMVLSVKAYALLPLATATVLLFTAPLFVVLLSFPLLKEKVGFRRGFAVLIGFTGVAIVNGVQQDISTLGLVVGLAAGFANAMVHICLRWLGSSEHASTTTFYFLFFGLLGTGAFMPFIAHPIPGKDVPLLAALGIIGLTSLLLKTQSFRLAPASLISPVSYTILIWAALYDYFIWDELIDIATLIGGLVIITSNSFILYREHQLSKQKAAEQPD